MQEIQKIQLTMFQDKTSVEIHPDLKAGSYQVSQESVSPGVEPAVPVIENEGDQIKPRVSEWAQIAEKNRKKRGGKPVIPNTWQDRIDING